MTTFLTSNCFKSDQKKRYKNLSNQVWIKLGIAQSSSCSNYIQLLITERMSMLNILNFAWWYLNTTPILPTLLYRNNQNKFLRVCQITARNVFSANYQINLKLNNWQIKTMAGFRCIRNLNNDLNCKRIFSYLIWGFIIC